MTITLRPYQEEALSALQAGYGRGLRRPAVVAATGAGKTIMIANQALRHRQAHGGRVLVVAHRIELIEQNAAKLLDVAPTLNVGIVKANRNETRADVISASIQTLASERRRQMLRDVSLVVVDECHRAAAPSYMTLLRHFGAWEDGGAIAAGYTATMSRSDGKALGDVWQEIVYTKDIGSLVREGYLVRPRGLRVRVEDFDPTKVKRKGQDYDDEAMGEALEQSLAPQAIAKALIEHAAEEGRVRPTILFAPTVHSAGVIRDALVDAGLTAAAVSAATPAAERAALRADSEAGRVQVVCNVGLFVEGTDWPWISCVVLASPTRSKGTFIQKAGRGLRLYPGKQDCLLLMIGGAAAGHSLLAPVELFGESAEDLQRDPCCCRGEGGYGGAWSGDSCECGRRKCLPECPCGGGGQDCGCPRPPDDELLEDDGELGDDVTGVLGADGPLSAVEIDLFADSRVSWDQTRAGIWYVDAGEHLVAIVPGDPAGKGGYDVVAMVSDVSKVPPGGRRSYWVSRGTSEIGYAMAHGEDAARHLSSTMTLVDRKARWRKDGASEGQLWRARRMGIVVPEGVTKGELSGMISKQLASDRIDQHIPAYARQALAGTR